jgi:acetyl esterase/lipase
MSLSRPAVTLTRRTLLRTAAAAGAGALAACAPTRAGRGARPLPITRTLPFERIAYGSDPQQFGELRRPPGAAPCPVVVVVHGGFWLSQYDLSLMVPVCEALTYEGLATWNIEYRRLGDPGGGWPGTFLDVGAAVDHLRSFAPHHGLEMRRTITLGHSAGGQLALWIAGRRWIRTGDLARPRPFKPRGAVSLAGIVDLRRAYDLGLQSVATLMGGSPVEFAERYDAASPAALLPLGIPQVLVHGTVDPLVPEALSVEYQREAKARGDDVKFIALEGIGHFELIDPKSAAWPTVRDAVRGLLAS